MRYPVKYLSSQKQVRTGLCTGTKGSHALNLTAMDPFQYHIFWSDHRITEWFGLEGLYRNLVPTHLPWAGTPPPRSDVTAGAPIWDKKQVLSLIFIFDRLDSLSFHRRLGVFLQGVLWFKHRVEPDEKAAEWHPLAQPVQEAGLDADHGITSAGFYHLGSCEAEPERTRGPEHS